MSFAGVFVVDGSGLRKIDTATELAHNFHLVNAHRIYRCSDVARRWISQADDKAERVRRNDLTNALLAPMADGETGKLRDALRALIAAMGREVAESILTPNAVSLYLEPRSE